MKIIICTAVIFAFTPAGFAQIDRILAPLPDGAQTEQQEAALVASLQNGAATTPAAAREADHPAQRLLNAGDILPCLQKQIADYYALKGDFKLDFARPWQPVKLPAEDFEATITDYPGDGVSSAFLVRCKIVSSGKTVGEWQIALHAQLWQQVWGATGRLDRGQALDRSLVAPRTVDVLRDKEAFLPAEASPEAYNMAQSVQEGRPLRKSDVVERPLIHKGQVVEVIARQGLFDVRMKALALEDGGANAIIKMRNTDSQKDFNAQIINENQVQVSF